MDTWLHFLAEFSSGVRRPWFTLYSCAWRSRHEPAFQFIIFLSCFSDYHCGEVMIASRQKCQVPSFGLLALIQVWHQHLHGSEGFQLYIYIYICDYSYGS